MKAAVRAHRFLPGFAAVALLCLLLGSASAQETREYDLPELQTELRSRRLRSKRHAMQCAHRRESE